MWLFIPNKYLTLLRSAKDTTELVLGFPSLNPLIETSVAWREKYFPLQIWSKRLKKYSWMKNLNGLTFQPSEYPAFEDWWIASLRESRVNRLVALENSAALPTHDGYGLQSSESLTTSDLASCSLKKYLDSKNMDSPCFSETLPKSGMMRCGIIFERPTWKPRTKKERESSSSHDWRTPTAGDGLHGGPNQRDSGGTPMLTSQVHKAKDWTTPSVATAEQGQNEADGRRGQTLTGQVRGQDWPTLTASMVTMQDLEQAKFAGNDPQRPKYSEIGKDWATPRAEEAEHPGRKKTKPNQTAHLAAQVAVSARPTPTTRDYKDVGNMMNVPENHLLGRRVARTEFGLREMENLNTDGSLLEQSTSNQNKPEIKTGFFLLNPRWVEMLMGIPVGWTNSDYAEMESYLQWRGLHGSFLKRFLSRMGYGET